MTDNLLPPFPEVWDSSMRSAFVACPRQWYNAYLLGLRKSAVSVHLHFGSCLAVGVEMTRRAFWQDRLDEGSAVAVGLQAAILAWGDFELTPELLSSRAGVKTLEACLDALYSYFEYFPLASDQITPVIVNDEPLIEKTCALPLPDCFHPITREPILYAGRFDMIGQHGAANFVVDEKTTTSLGSTWRSNWPLRGQLTGYCWLARSFGLPISGAVVRGIGVLKGSIQFEQVILSRPDWLVDQWRSQVARDINRAAGMWLEARDRCADEPHLAFDQAFDSACSSYGGCGFVNLCETQNPVGWYDEFVQVAWDPLRREGDAL